MTLFLFCLTLLILQEETVLFLCGVSDISEVPQEQLEHFQNLSRNPLKINLSSRGQIEESALFSSYQIASLEDYRLRCGDVLSPLELCSVDGFSRQFVEYVSVFLDFSASGAGSEVYNAARGHPFRLDSSGGGGVKTAGDEGKIRFMAKAKGEWGPLAASVAARTAWERAPSGVEELGWSVSYRGKRVLTAASVGCFNARFGQGLLQWSGVVFNSLSSPQSLMKKPSGISAYTSYSASSCMRGAALRLDLGHFSVSPFADIASQRYGCNAAWNHRNGEVGVTCLYGGGLLALSADFQQTIKGVVLYSEVTTLGSGTLGVRFPLWRFDSALRASFSSDEHSVVAAASCLSDNRIHSIDVSSSLSYLPAQNSAQLRCLVCYRASVDSVWTVAIRSSLRRKKNYSKYEIRSDFSVNFSPSWQASCRFHAARCLDWAFLSYMEGGFTARRLSAYLQGGVFKVDFWDDRIYVYRRDVPGAYNVPAMYGRGVWAALFISVKFGKNTLRPWGSLAFRADCTAYPWARSDDARTRPSSGVMLQMTITI